MPGIYVKRNRILHMVKKDFINRWHLSSDLQKVKDKAVQISRGRTFQLVETRSLKILSLCQRGEDKGKY